MIYASPLVVYICLTHQYKNVRFMDRSKAIERITEILDDSKIGILSTAKDDVPNARYMWFYNDGITLYAKTSDESPKFDEIEENPAFVECYGEIEVIRDQETINWLWENQDKDFFDNKENPHLVALKINPTSIKIMNDDEFENVELSL